jgi:hypothetical protein
VTDEVCCIPGFFLPYFVNTGNKISYYNIMVFSISIAACLGLHSVPESGWHCLNCEDNTGDERGARPIMIRLTRVDKEPEYEVGGCVVCR